MIQFLYVALYGIDDSFVQAKLTAKNSNKSYRARRQELNRSKCIEQSTMRIQESKRELRNNGDERETLEPVYERLVSACVYGWKYKDNFV